MFGSLVIVYPAPHEGGELVLRHKGREWEFDANSLTAFSPSLAYVAFYSDIEHEVLRVTSGHRVTITFNLYLDDPMSKKRRPLSLRTSQQPQTSRPPCAACSTAQNSYHMAER